MDKLKILLKNVYTTGTVISAGGTGAYGFYTTSKVVSETTSFREKIGVTLIGVCITPFAMVTSGLLWLPVGTVLLTSKLYKKKY